VELWKISRETDMFLIVRSNIEESAITFIKHKEAIMFPEDTGTIILMDMWGVACKYQKRDGERVGRWGVLQLVSNRRD